MNESWVEVDLFGGNPRPYTGPDPKPAPQPIPKPDPPAGPLDADQELPV